MKVLWESIQTAPHQCVRFLHLDQTRFSGALHAHDALEITWIQSGEGLRFVAGTVEPFQAGDLVLVAPGAPHTWLSTGPRGARAQALVVQVMSTEALVALPGWGEVQTRIWQGQSAAFVLGDRLHQAFVEHLRVMVSGSELQRLGHTLSMLALCTQALRSPCPAPDQNQPLRPLGRRTPRSIRGDAGRRRRVESLLRWVQQHLASPLNAVEAAQWLNVSPAAFSRAFRHAVGKPFSEYVNDLRIAQASLELLRSDRPIAEIAERCGYPTLSNFHQQWHARHAQSPRRYRAQVQPLTKQNAASLLPSKSRK